MAIYSCKFKKKIVKAYLGNEEDKKYLTKKYWCNQ